MLESIFSTLFLFILLAGDYYYLHWIIDGHYQNSEIAAVYFIGLILGIVNAGIVWGVAHKFLAVRKGKLKILVEDKIYEPEDKLAGTLSVNLKVPLKVEALEIRFTATNIRRESERTYCEVVWKKEIVLVNSTNLKVGKYNFEFSFDIPSEAKDVNNPLLLKLFNFIVNGEVSWHLEARLSTQGVDLSDSKLIKVNSGPRF